MQKSPQTHLGGIFWLKVGCEKGNHSEVEAEIFLFLNAQVD